MATGETYPPSMGHGNLAGPRPAPFQLEQWDCTGGGPRTSTLSLVPPAAKIGLMRALIPLALLASVGFAATLSPSGCSSNSGEPFDASESGLPKSCQPDEARSISVGECSGCTEIAYALCQWGTFSECSCSLPSGYTVVSGRGGGD
jgi:hypothetical protein